MNDVLGDVAMFVLIIAAIFILADLVLRRVLGSEWWK